MYQNSSSLDILTSYCLGMVPPLGFQGVFCTHPHILVPLEVHELVIFYLLLRIPHKYMTCLYHIHSYHLSPTPELRSQLSNEIWRGTKDTKKTRL